MADSPQSQSTTEVVSAPKACDHCRRRKIRCDRKSPCSTCAAAGRECTTCPKLHIRNPRQRILISNKYEEKVDQIDLRLKEIENALKRLAVSRQSTPASVREKSYVSPSSVKPDPDTAVSESQDGRDNASRRHAIAMSGDCTLKNQSVHAGEFLERVIMSRLAAVPSSNSPMVVAVANLQHLVARQRRNSQSLDYETQRFPMQKPMPPEGPSKLAMPPLPTILQLLNQTMRGPPTVFSSNCALVGITSDDFLKLCKAVHESSDNASHSDMIIVNTGLYWLFGEQRVYAMTRARQEEYLEITQLCQENVETLLKSVPLFSSEKIPRVQALLLGVFYAIDACWPSVAWHFNSMATQLCHSGGFHRSRNAVDDDPQASAVKETLFWTTFMFDKCLSLRLGRASVTRETDLTVPTDMYLSGADQLDEGGLSKIWLMTSPLRARTYEQLYSPAAIACSPAEMTRRAKSLGAECQVMEKEMTKIRTEAFIYISSSCPSELIRLYITSSTVQFYVILTLVYRMIPPPEGSPYQFCQECIEAARNAIQFHLDGVKLVGADDFFKAIYVHWTLMLTPFAPFFVLFCHVIETPDPSDMDLLRRFIASLEDLRCASKTAEKLSRLCKAMWEVASAYHEDVYCRNNIITNSSQQVQPMMGDDFNMYLNQLGFGMQDSAVGDVQMAELGDWFLGGPSVFE